MKKSRRRRAVVLGSSGVLAAGAVFIGAYGGQAFQASGQYDAARGRLHAELRQAAGAGYTPAELAPVATRDQQLEAAQAPLWVVDQPGFYQRLAAELAQLRTSLRGAESAALQNVRQQSLDTLLKTQAQVGDAATVGVDASDLAPLQSQLHTLQSAEGAAVLPRDFRAVTAQAETLLSNAAALAKAQEAVVAALEASAQQLMAQKGGSVAAVQQAGRLALAGGRNDASIAAYMRFTGFTHAVDSLERYGALLTATDPHQVALAAAGAIHYSQTIHQQMVADMPAHAIVVDYTAQHLWAYAGADLVVNTPVTTGRPQLPTDLGRMRVLAKNSPWTMRSPWPKTSQWYYPPTVVQMVLWFTDTGEGLHDASWEYPSQYGPGSQFGPAASHGCIHLPGQAETVLFNWAPIGTPVVVFPGDGTTVANQLSQITVDAAGQPLTGPKGA
ncbi:MAG: L,D-transpeptidase [Candidatus Dormibacteraceae bacterium]